MSLHARAPVVDVTLCSAKCLMKPAAAMQSAKTLLYTYGREPWFLQLGGCASYLDLTSLPEAPSNSMLCGHAGLGSRRSLSARRVQPKVRKHYLSIIQQAHWRFDMTAEITNFCWDAVSALFTHDGSQAVCKWTLQHVSLFCGCFCT